MTEPSTAALSSPPGSPATSRSGSPRLRRRPSRTVPAGTVAVVLLALGLIATVSGAFALVQGGWPAPVRSVAGAATTLTWGAPATIAVTAAVGVIGVVLLLAAIIPGGFTSAQLAVPGGSSADATEAVISNRGLARLAAAAADTVDGVDRVSTSVARETVRVAVVTSSAAEAQLVRDRVQHAVAARLEAAGLRPAPRIHTRVSTKEL